MNIQNQKPSNSRGIRCSVAATTLAVIAMAAPTAHAWEAPVFLSGAGTTSYASALVVDGKGRAVAAWQQFDGVHYRATAAVRPKGEAFLPLAMISPAGEPTFSLNLAANQKGNVIAVWDGHDGSIFRAIAADLAPKATSFGGPTTISPDGLDIEFARVGLDKKGNALAMWTVPYSSSRLEASSRPVGGTFGTPAILEAVGGSDHSVMFDKKGNAMAVWRKMDDIRSALRPKGEAFDLAVDVSDPDMSAFYPSAAFDNKGNALVLWNATTELLASERPAKSSFGLPFEVSAASVSGWARMAFDKKGNLFVAWTRAIGLGDYRAVYATRTADGVWSVENELAPTTLQSIVGDVAMDAKGNVRVIWSEYDEILMTRDVVTAYRPAGGAFGPAEYLALDISGSVNANPKIEMDKKGNAVAIWVQEDAGFERVASSFDAAP